MTVCSTMPMSRETNGVATPRTRLPAMTMVEPPLLRLVVCKATLMRLMVPLCCLEGHHQATYFRGQSCQSGQTCMRLRLQGTRLIYGITAKVAQLVPPLLQRLTLTAAATMRSLLRQRLPQPMQRALTSPMRMFQEAQGGMLALRQPLKNPCGCV